MQLTLFGRPLSGAADALPGFARGRVPIAVADAPAGRSHHENAVVTGRSADRIEGTALEVTDAELEQADTYEAAADYVRLMVTLASGGRAWVYVHGPSRPPE